MNIVLILLNKLIKFKLIILIILISEVRCLEVLYSRYFDQSFLCNSLTEIVKVGGTFSSNDQCMQSCQIENNGGNIYSLSPLQTDYLNGFEIEQVITQPYQFIGVEFIYYTSEKFYMSIYDGPTLLETMIVDKFIAENNLQQINYSFECGFNPLYTIYQSYKLTQTFTSNKLKVRFTGNPSLPSTYGFMKIKMWANCLENCLVCNNASSCSTCIQGFTLVQLSSGQSVCSEITPQCKQVNCFQCVSSTTSDLQICLQCMPGFILDQSTNLCVANTGSVTCNSSQYLDENNTCKFYSKSCLMQDPQDNTKWIQCGQIPPDTLIKCSKNQNILLYDLQNYQVRNCGCTQSFCLSCISTSKCDYCVTGYKLVSGVCQFDVCPSGWLQNPTTKLCEYTICSSNCQNCTATECIQCIPGNYYISSSNKQTCLLCSIPNCAQCDNSGLCQTCLYGYTINTARTQCQTCLVNNCTECVNSQSNQCSICVSGYQLNASLQCNCQAQNCSKCLESDGNLCDTCVYGYVKNQNQVCECKVQNCQICHPSDGSICITCQNPNEEFDPIQGICTCKVKYCSSCLSSECDGQCSNQMYYNPLLKQCLCKIQNCDSCLNGICTSCANNFVSNVSKTECLCTISNCQSCSKTDGSKCEKCNLNFIQNQTEQCGGTANNCLVYDASDGSKCLTCQNNYDLINSNCYVRVLKCIKGVDNDGSRCQTCIQGYAPDASQTTCVCTLSYCTQCDPNDGTFCQQCAQNFDLVSNNQVCKCQVNNCENCNQSDGYFCDTCKNQYSLTQDKRQCILMCFIPNCAECEQPPNNMTQCKKCEKGFVVDSITRSCVPCQAANCEYCLEYNPNQCQICKQNYEILQSSNNECVLRQCQVFGCAQCNTTDLNKCNTCSSDYILDDSTGLCKVYQENSFDISQKQTLNGYNIYLAFRREVTFQTFPSINEVIKANILNFDSYDTSITQTSEKEVSISLTPKKDCKGQSLLIKMDDRFVKVNNLIKQQEQITLVNYAIINQDQVAQAETTKQVTENVKTTLITTMLPIAMIGNFYVLFNTIDLTTFIYYLLYVKVRYPINITNFCGVFQNFQMAFIPNIFQAYWLEGYTQNKTPIKFLENGADAYFLNGGGQSITIVGGIMTVYLLLKIVSKINVYKPFQLYVQSKIESGWEYCGFFDLIWTVYMYVLVSCFLQLFDFSFDNSFSFLNYSIWALFSLSVFFIPVWITIFISKQENLNDPMIQQQYGSIIGGLIIPEQDSSNLEQESPNFNDNEENQQLKGGLNDKGCNSRRSSIMGISMINQQQQSLFNHQIISQDSPSLTFQGYQKLTTRQKFQNQWSKYTNVFLYFRKIFYAIFIIFFADFPYLQLFTMSLLNLFLAVHYFYTRPHQKNIENIRNGISEVVLIVMQCTICILVNDSADEVEQDRINVGWVLIACAASILLLHIVFVVLDLIKGLFNLIKDFIQILIKFKKGLITINQNKEDDTKIRLKNMEKLGAIIPNVISMNNFRRSDTKKLTGLFISNLNTSMMSSPRKSERKNTKINEQAINGVVNSKLIDTINMNPSSPNRNLRNIDNNSPGDISMVSYTSKIHLQMEQKQSDKQIINQNLSILSSKQNNLNNSKY